MYHNRKANATINNYERHKGKEYESIHLSYAFVI